MQKSVFLLALISWLGFSCLAQDGGAGLQQPGPGGGNMLESTHIGYLTQRLNLSPAEAQRFWPVYNQYATEIHQARVAYRMNKDVLALDEVILGIKKRYNIEFGRALSPARASQFWGIERDFGNFVRQEWMQRKQMRIQQRRAFR